MKMKDIIIFIDSGDTLVDESTERRVNGREVFSAELFPGAAEILAGWHEAGYRIALVADGLEVSFRNVYKQHGLEDCFESWTISEIVGKEKPDRVMFESAMEKMGLTESDKERIVMVGNNLERDVTGANRLGICSVLAGYSPRYRMRPETEEEIPDYVLSDLRELPPLLELLNMQYGNRKKICGGKPNARKE